MTLLLARSDVADLLTIDDCIGAVEDAFRRLGRGDVDPPVVASVRGHEGGFHIKAASMSDRFAAKINGNFWRAVPRIKGVIVLADASDGTMLAVMDSIEITTLRTGAATAVAAKALARADARTALVIGCGNQGRIQLRAIQRVRTIDHVYAVDEKADVARAFARDTGAEIVRAPVDADIVITCTPSKSPVLSSAKRGAFIAAVGADSGEKHEIAPALLASSKVVTDLTEQCATIGDLHHAIEAWVMKREQVHAELAEIVAGRKAGRESADEVIVFDSTGMALQDVAAAILVYERALATGRGQKFAFA
jgi:ornithine cyclodeaminase/alanine dehydrogenase-like protein (mu-crystallin family)